MEPMKKQQILKRKGRCRFYVVGGMVFLLLISFLAVWVQSAKKVEPVLLNSQKSEINSIEKMLALLTAVEKNALLSLQQPSEFHGLASTKNEYKEQATVLLGVPYHSQDTEYPTGCEIVSATMLLQFYGYQTSEEEYIEKLDIVDFYREDGVLYGPDPTKHYAGDPTDPYSCGCYAPVIVKSMNKILDHTQVAKEVSGASLQELAERYVQNGSPVLVWASVDMEPTQQGDQWTIIETGERFTWITPEHCLVLVGYNEKYFYFNDPYEGNGLVRYDKSLAQQRYQELGKQAVVICDR